MSHAEDHSKPPAPPESQPDQKGFSVAAAHRKAQHFIDHEKQFHLGVLPTEQSHPRTVGLAETAQRDLDQAVRMLQAVDGELVPRVTQVLAGVAFQRLVEAMRRALAGRGRICFSGCGATGRLSILLEAAWRRFWQETRQQCPEIAARLPPLEHQVISIMTGGDYALIRSVENFEDHSVFGRRQVQEAELGKGDVLVAISEGGETSSVIGTIWQSLDNGAEVFFVFNNPAEVLARHIERSRQVIEDPRVTILDLSCGPMALAGSTRMQATTSEMLVAGAALETALVETLRARLDATDLDRLALPGSPALDYSSGFTRLLQDLAQPEAIASIAAMVRFEEQLYRSQGLVTYLAARCLLDIFTDTTERSPTFMLPRFRSSDDLVSPLSWAFVKDPRLPTPGAWREVLCREPRCLTWDAALYRQLGAPASLQANPPHLAQDDMYKFLIGNEDDPPRYSPAANAAIFIALGDEASRLDLPGDPLRVAFDACSRPYRHRALLAVGPSPPGDLPFTVWHVAVRPVASPLRLYDRLALKLVLNTVSTATMARLGRVVSNWMAHVEPTNKKLIDRGTRLVAEIAGVDYQTACYVLHETIEQLTHTVKPGQEKPSPVALAIARLQRQTGSTTSAATSP
jgi:N-acetylmuramic acid 6-phosphate etherase